MNNLKRNVHNKVAFLLEKFPVVAILGARQVGKTTLAKQVAPDWKYFDLEDPQAIDRLQHDPSFFFKQHPKHLIIDEAQIYPPLFSILRSVIDQSRNEKGRFLITGSSSPELLSQISETLAGRIAIIELGTLKANERYQQPLSTFYDLFKQKISREIFETLSSPLSSEQIQTAWFYGGYPEPVLQDDPLFFRHWMDNYRKTYIHRDIAKLFPRLNQQAYQRFLSILSKLSSTIINKSDVARAIEVSEGTIREYLSIASGTFLWRNLPSYEQNVTKTVIKMPKGYLRDPGLLHYLLRISDLEDLYNHPTIGHSFEGFVIEEIIKGLEATLVTNWQPYYYRTRNGAEIDLILEGPFGLLPIEIKYGTTILMKQLRSLIEFVDEHQLPFGIVVNQSERLEWLSEQIIQVPVGYL